MASFVLAQIDAAISLFTSLLQLGARTPRYSNNLQWLLNLRTRALAKMSGLSAAQRDGQDPSSGLQNNNCDGDRSQDEDVELLGWRTRLIERVGQGRQKTIRTIHLVDTPTDSQTSAHIITDVPLDDSNLQGQLGTIDLGMPTGLLPAVNLDSTDDIVSQMRELPLLETDFEP